MGVDDGVVGSDGLAVLIGASQSVWPNTIALSIGSYGQIMRSFLISHITSRALTRDA